MTTYVSEADLLSEAVASAGRKVNNIFGTNKTYIFQHIITLVASCSIITG